MAVFLDEILVHIFEYFDAYTLTRVALVCKQWSNFSRTPRLWRSLVLQKWPSQRFLYKNVPVTCENWYKVYQDLYLRGKYSPDDMKYFISCRVGEDELDVEELREAMLLHTAKVVMKWALAEPFEAEENGSFPPFDSNFDFYYDTHDFKWKFIDKRQEYIEDLMGYKLSTKMSRKSRYIRPYQVIPSCLMLYRWLSVFRSNATIEEGLTFYRIWRHHIKHRETGMLFEMCDWKAAMSCTFLKGKPASGTYANDCLELMDLLSHPHFIMHPLGMPSAIVKKSSLLSPPSGMSRQTSVSSLISNLPRSLGGSMDRLSEGRVSWMRGTSGTESDDESELVYDDSGYYANCEYFISISHWDIEEQHTIQLSVAELWSVTQTSMEPQLFLSFDALEENWYFYTYNSFSNSNSLSPIDKNGHSDDLRPISESLSKHILDRFHGFAIEPIPSCLALYRLICLFDLNANNYVSTKEGTIWSVTVVHNQTGARLNLKDTNGWFEASVCLTDELMDQLNTSQIHSNNAMISYNTPPNDVLVADLHPPSQWNDEYDGDDDDDGYDDTDEDGDDHDVDDDDKYDDIDQHSYISRHSQENQNIEELMPQDAEAERIGNVINIINESYNNDDAVNQVDGDYLLEPVGVTAEPNNAEQTDLELFKYDVVCLLNLLINEKFGHPYGTIAGAVA